MKSNSEYTLRERNTNKASIIDEPSIVKVIKALEFYAILEYN